MHQCFSYSQTACHIIFPTDSYEEEDLMLEWFDTNAVEIEDDIELPQFDLLNVTIMKCDARKYKTGMSFVGASV